MTPHPPDRCYWMSQGLPEAPRAQLDGELEVDVAIIGGGFTGLWTAWFLKESDPSLRIAVLEQGRIGFGASGRNAGFAVPALDHSLPALLENHGADAARLARGELVRSVHALGQFAQAHGIACEYEATGRLAIANGEGQLRRVEAEAEAAVRLGLKGFIPLDRAQIQGELHSARFAGALFEQDCALLQPAKLVRGLAGVVEKSGVRIFEQSRLEALHPGAKSQLVTRTGRVIAQSVVLSVNAWSNQQLLLRRQQLPMFTYILLSRPLTLEQRARIGWARRQGAEDMDNYLHYFRLTPDGRLLWGGEARYFFGGSVDPAHATHAGALRAIEHGFRRTFPSLADLVFEHRWGGAFSLTVGFVPALGQVPGTNVFYGFGCCGHGVAASHCSGQILRDLVLGRKTDRTGLFFVGGPRGAVKFPGEPAAFLGIQASRWALKRQDRRMSQGKAVDARAPWIIRQLKRLSPSAWHGRRQRTKRRGASGAHLPAPPEADPDRGQDEPPPERGGHRED